MVMGLQIGNLQAMAQFLSNASKSLSGTLADILSPARMIIFGTLLTTINKPMFALSGYVFASFGTVVCLYWVTFAKVFDRMSKGVREAPGKALIGELAAESGDKTEGAFGMFFTGFWYRMVTSWQLGKYCDSLLLYRDESFEISPGSPGKRARVGESKI